jgi:hypothetical protein
VHLLRRQPVKRFRDIAPADLLRLFERLAPRHLGDHAGCGDRGAASQRLELDVGDDIVLDLDVYEHHIATDWISDLSDAVRVRDLSDIPRVLEVL